MIWIPAHSGIEGNLIANKLAEQLPRDCTYGPDSFLPSNESGKFSVFQRKNRLVQAHISVMSTALSRRKSFYWRSENIERKKNWIERVRAMQKNEQFSRKLAHCGKWKVTCCMQIYQTEIQIFHMDARCNPFRPYPIRSRNAFFPYLYQNQSQWPISVMALQNEKQITIKSGRWFG